MQTLLKELSLYCPLKLSSKCKVSCVKGGWRGIEHEEANFGPPFIALGRAKKHPSTEYLSGNHEATLAYQVQGTWIEQYEGMEESTEGRQGGYLKEPPSQDSSRDLCRNHELIFLFFLFLFIPNFQMYTIYSVDIKWMI